MDNSSDLVNFSQKLRNSANKLIQESNIQNVVSELGKLHFVGGYRLDVLTRPDLDIIIESEEEPKRESAINITETLLNNGYFQTIGFADTYNFDIEGKPRGYYWELIKELDGAQWKIDMWYMKIQDNYPVIKATSEFETLLNKSPDLKSTILRLKQEDTRNGKYLYNLNGFKIYEAVLKNNITTSEELKKFYKIL